MAQNSNTERIVVLVDMDCFYCQVEEKLNPLLNGKPMAVVQYNTWRGGGIIAVNYPARDRGVTRHMRGNEAKEKCPEIELVQVPEVRGKADLTKYREAGKQVAEVLQTFTPYLQRASVDEAYLDITEAVKQKALNCGEIKHQNMQNTFVVGCDTPNFLSNVNKNRQFVENDFYLAVGGLITEEIRAVVYEKTGYKCSAGIAHNKILAKLVCGLHKPNKQTILPHEAVSHLYETLPIKKIKSLGGKFGVTVAETLKIQYMSELSKFSEKELQKHFDEKTTHWLYNIARGIDLEPVTTRLVSKSIGCCKRFPGRTALKTPEDVEHWLNELAEELSERLSKDLEENNRRAKQMIVNYTQPINKKDVSSSRTVQLNSYEKHKMVKTALDVIQKNCLRNNEYCIKFLGLNVNNFEDVKKVREITSFFKVGQVNKIQEVEIQSDSTDIMSENDEELVYFDDAFPERSSPILSKNQIDKEEAYESDDSISNEISTDLNKSDNSKSFFSKYFNNLKETSNRNFDTSKIFEETSTSSSTNENEPETSVISEECPECHKKIQINELISHMDYHMALKIVREEAHLYKNDINHSPNKAKKQIVSKKRKFSNLKQTKSILQFLKQEEIDVYENGELCSQCNKKIKLDDFSSHMDYHAAKELHLKLNQPVLKKPLVGKKKLAKKT